MNVKRYNAEHAIWDDDGDSYKLVRSTLAEDDDGQLVLHSDYASLLEQLDAMRKDRDLWQDAHDEDCPNKAQLTEALARAERAEKALQTIRQWCVEQPGHEECRCLICEAIPMMVDEGLPTSTQGAGRGESES